MYKYLPDLLAVQLESFRYFLEIGLRIQLEEGLKNITTPQGQFKIHTTDYKFTRPSTSPQSALEKIGTYSTVLYIPISFTPFQLPFPLTRRIYFEKKIEQKSLFSYYAVQEFPLLTDSSYFVVNGVRRVVVNQMVRCPNIYYKVELIAKNKRRYSVSFISDRGLWIRIQRDQFGFIWVLMNEFKIEISIFLRILGVTDTILEKTFQKNFIEESIDVSREFAFETFGLSLFEITNQHQDSREFIYQNIFNESRYSLSKGGRMRMNKKFGFSSSILTLRPEDFLAGLEAFLELELGHLEVDDIDHLKNRRVRLLHHLLADQTRRGLKRLKEENGFYFKNDNLFLEEEDNEESDDNEFWNQEEEKQNKNESEKKDDEESDNELGEEYVEDEEYEEYEEDEEDEENEGEDKDDKKEEKFSIYKSNHFTLELSVHPRNNKKSIFQNELFSNRIEKPKNSKFFIYNKLEKKNYKNFVDKELLKENLFNSQKKEFVLLHENERKLFLKSKSITKTLNEFFGLSPLSQFMDQINPLAGITQKRRLTCLGPGGVSHQSGVDIRDIHPSHYGRVCPIETPEGKNAGLVNSLASYATISIDGSIKSYYNCAFKQTKKNGAVLLEAQEQTQEIFYPYTVPDVSQNDNRLSLVQDTNGNIRKKEDVYLISISPIAMISVATCLIPFLEHNDGNRALMASNMQRQAVPLLKPDRPIVGTGFEAIIARDSRSVIVSPLPGKVVYVDANTILIEHKISNLFVKKNVLSKFFLDPFSRSNHNTLLYQYPSVKKDQILSSGDILADTSTTHKGELSLGKNALVAYMPWEGYNFEDAVLLNHRMVSEQGFTSIHIEKFKTRTEMIDSGFEELYIPPLKSKYRYDRYGIIRPGIFVRSGEILVGKCKPKVYSESPEERLLYAILGNAEKKSIIDCSLILSHGIRGRVFETFFFPKQESFKLGSVHIHLLIKRPIQIGDKIAGRHGNKGIISNIVPNSDMPYLQDGTTVDIVLNPLGVPSRMNVGQIFECLLGLAGTYLEEYYRIRAFDEIFGKNASQILVYDKIRKAKKDFWWLNNALNTFGKIPLFDGRTGLLFENPITVGVAYILKLVHLVDDKIHARVQGPYTLLTQQPVKGRSSDGGQRVGEMEVWALQGFSVPYILQEMLTLKSDDCSGRIDLSKAILFGNKLPNSNIPESFNVTLMELRALCFDLRYSVRNPNELERKKLKRLKQKMIELKKRKEKLKEKARILKTRRKLELSGGLQKYYLKNKKLRKK